MESNIKKVGSSFRGDPKRVQNQLAASRGIKAAGRKRVLAEYYVENESGSLSSIVETGGGVVRRQKYRTVFPMVPKVVGQSIGKTYDQVISITDTKKAPNFLGTFDLTGGAISQAKLNQILADNKISTSTQANQSYKQMLDFYGLMHEPVKTLLGNNYAQMKTAGYPDAVVAALLNAIKPGVVDMYLFTYGFENALTSNLATSNDWYANNGFQIMTEDRDLTIHAPKVQMYDSARKGYTMYIPCLVGAFVDLQLAGQDTGLFQRVVGTTSSEDVIVLSAEESKQIDEEAKKMGRLSSSGVKAFESFSPPGEDYAPLPVKNSMHLCCPVFTGLGYKTEVPPTYEELQKQTAATNTPMSITKTEYEQIIAGAKAEAVGIGRTDGIVQGQWSWNHRKITNTSFYRRIVVLIPQVKVSAELSYHASMSYQVARDLIWFKRYPTTMMDLLKTKQSGFVRLEEFPSDATITKGLIKQKKLIGVNTFFNTQFKMGKRQRMAMIATIRNRDLTQVIADHPLFKWALGLWGLVELDSSQFAKQLEVGLGMQIALNYWNTPTGAANMSANGALHAGAMLEAFAHTYTEIYELSFADKQAVQASREECISSAVLSKMSKRMKGFSKNLNMVSKSLQKSIQDGQIMSDAVSQLAAKARTVNGYSFGNALIRVIFFSAFTSGLGGFNDGIEIGNTIAQGFLLDNTKMPKINTKTIVQDLKQTSPAVMIQKMEAIVRAVYKQSTPAQIQEAYSRILKASTTYAPVIDLSKPKTLEELIQVVFVDFFLEYYETTFALSAMYQSGNFKGMSDSQMLGLVLYLNLYGKVMLDNWVNVNVSSDYTQFTTKRQDPSRMPVLEYIHGQFCGLIRTLRETRKSKLFSYNLFFFYSDAQTPDLDTLKRDISNFIDLSEEDVAASNLIMTQAFAKLTQAGIGYMASGGARKPGASAAVVDGTIHNELKDLMQLGLRD